MDNVLLSQQSAVHQALETVVYSTPAKLWKTTPTNHNAFQPERRRSSLTITVEKTEHLKGSKLKTIDYLSPQHQLCSSTEDTRRAQLKNKKVLFICCGHDGLDSKKFAFERVQEFGTKVYLLEDAQNTLAVAMEQSKTVEQLIRFDMRPRMSLLEEAMVAVQGVADRIGGFDGVCTLWDDAVGFSARIADRLGLPGPAVRSIDISHDKHLTRDSMEKIGLPIPAHYLLKCEKDLDAAAEVVGVPAILKPMYGASSLAVVKVTDLSNLREAYQRVLRMLKHFYEEGELMGLTFNQEEFGPTFEQSSLSWLVMEEFLDGDEVDVDIVLQNGKALYHCVCDDWPMIQPWFVEMGNNCPSILSPSVQQELIAVAFETSTKAMGFRNGVLHCEVKNTTKGPRLIEVNPRMGGGPVWSLHKLAFGVDLVEETLYAALAIEGAPTIPSSPNRYVSCGEKFFDKSMVVPKEFCRVVEAMRLFPNVIESTSLVAPGEKIIGIKDGFPTRTARFVVCGESPAEAEMYARKLLDMCDIPQVIKAQQAC